jgi:predicted dehydrogenase
MHVDVGLMAVERGIPFLVEKPLARTVQDCDRLIDACESAGGRGAVAQVARYFPEHERANELIRQGRIGRPASVRISRTGRAPVGSDAWFQNDSRSGGVLLDLAVHDIDWLLWTLGPAIRVTARCTGRGGAPAPEAAGQHALVILEHESGCISHCESSWMDPRGFSTALDAAGSEGVIEFDTRRFSSISGAGPEGPFAASPNEASADPYARQLRDFLAMAASGGPPAVSLQEAREAVRICLAAIKSSETGRPVDLAASPR